jgi:diaminopimelate epimerase
MRFTKMHGAGNDYIYVDCFRDAAPQDVPAFARTVSDRHRGIGADGVILIGPSARADARMQMWNADGSRAEMCGNGLRCVAKYVFDHGIARKDLLRIETDRGVLAVTVEAPHGTVERVQVNMGAPILEASAIPTTLPGNPPIRASLELPGLAWFTGRRGLEVTCVSMGNPHCVVFVDELGDDWVQKVGPAIERHPAFPNRVNVEFVRPLSPSEVAIRVWERGSGETQACGTGACAVTVAGVLAGVSDRRLLVHLRGGDLTCQWLEMGDVLLAGPATEVFTGEWLARDVA